MLTALLHLPQKKEKHVALYRSIAIGAGTNNARLAGLLRLQIASLKAADSADQTTLEKLE